MRYHKVKREHIIESLVNQFAENIKNLSDETLQDVESGKLVISLTPSVGKESGGRASVVKAAEPARKLPEAARPTLAVKQKREIK